MHLVNPFGMHWSRRWNEGNVDLNRNTLRDEAFPGLKERRRELDANYMTFWNLLNPTRFREAKRAAASGVASTRVERMCLPATRVGA